MSALREQPPATMRGDLPRSNMHWIVYSPLALTFLFIIVSFTSLRSVRVCGLRFYYVSGASACFVLPVIRVSLCFYFYAYASALATSIGSRSRSSSCRNRNAGIALCALIQSCKLAQPQRRR